MLRRKGRPSRFLAAVVFTDIAGSTEVAARLGDEGWKQLLERHQRLIRSSLRRFGGREIDTAGDGLYATFESPAQAIRFALDVAERVEALDIRVRSGVHMGEVELIGRKAGGIAVHIGARIAALAEPGEVLVSGTVRDLVTGSAVGFEDRGTAELKGIPGRWALYAAKALERPAALPAEPSLPMRERMATSLQSTRARVILAAALLIALAGAAGLVNLLLQPRFLPGVEANSVGRIGEDGGGVVSAVQIGSIPDAMAFGEGSLWVTETTAGTVARIDPEDSRLVQTITVGNSPNAVAVGHGAIWVANGNDGTVSRVSPSTNRQIATITVGNGPSGVAADERWIWVTNRLDGTLARIDPASQEVIEFRIGPTPAGVATGAGSVWASDFDSGSVIRVDSATGQSFASIHVGNGPTSIAAAEGQVWVVNSRDGTVSRIDPVTNGVVATVAVGAEPGVVAVGGSVWVSVASTAEIVRIDPATNGIVKRISVGSRPRGVAIAGGDAWFTSRADTGSHRGGTLRIIGQSAGGLPTTLDPAESSDSTTGLDHVFLTNDGLVGWKRVGGSDGATLVADLAVRIPTPTDGGRTYTFKVRTGIVYSDGRPVRAIDVRRSIERVFRINPFAIELVGASLEGAEACASAPETCDLSSSIVVDDASGTVTFRLIAPDAEFLTRLAAPELVVLPADTPPEPATAPLPATGPYMAEPFDADGGIRLVRNEKFKEWSNEAQPAGYPDVIEWSIAGPGENSVAAVAAGQADLTLWSEAFTRDRIDEIGAHFTDRIHAHPSTRTWFQFMNTRLAPFDQLDVRQAVNLATDRDRVIELFGGELVGRATCQATPPGFPGYEPYCPYTVTPGTTWRAPDIAAAQNLIDRAGVRGTPVTVTTPEYPRPEFRAVNAYFVDLLNDLGFEASLKPVSIDEVFSIDVDPYEADIQMIGFWFDAPTPSWMISGAFTCPGFAPFPDPEGNFAAFCDPDVDALALHASGLQATDPTAANREWAKVDRLIVNQSPAVAAFNPIELSFVSERVGNVQVHPVLAILISQMWVQ